MINNNSLHSSVAPFPVMGKTIRTKRILEDSLFWQDEQHAHIFLKLSNRFKISLI